MKKNLKQRKYMFLLAFLANSIIFANPVWSQITPLSDCHTVLPTSFNGIFIHPLSDRIICLNGNIDYGIVLQNQGGVILDLRGYAMTSDIVIAHRHSGFPAEGLTIKNGVIINGAIRSVVTSGIPEINRDIVIENIQMQFSQTPPNSLNGVIDLRAVEGNVTIRNSLFTMVAGTKPFLAIRNSGNSPAQVQIIDNTFIHAGSHPSAHPAILGVGTGRIDATVYSNFFAGFSNAVQKSSQTSGRWYSAKNTAINLGGALLGGNISSANDIQF